MPIRILDRAIKAAPFKLRRIRRLISEVPDRIQWHLYRRRHRTSPYQRGTGADGLFSDAEELSSVDHKEKLVMDCIAQHQVKSFLEIGIGDWPKLDRLRMFVENGTHYTACDFENVCQLHRSHAIKSGIGVAAFEFLGNTRGTYAWSMFDLVQQGKTFDAIYIDGHHTFLVDMPAFWLAHFLLNPNGVLMVDDISWSLMDVADNMANEFHEWRFCHSIYNFNDYTETQISSPHIGMIVKSLLMEKMHYRPIPGFYFKSWMALQRQ